MQQPTPDDGPTSGRASIDLAMFNDYQVAELAKRGITPQQALDHGVVPVQTVDDLPHDVPDYWREMAASGELVPALLYPWTSITAGTTGLARQWQIKPDAPSIDPATGRPRKYLFPVGWTPVLHRLRLVHGSDRTLIVEGTNQAIAAAIYAPKGWNVLGISGCWGWSSEGLPTNDLLELAGHSVVIVLDADMATNSSVWQAGQNLAAELEMDDAASVRFARVTGTGRAGLDDVLGGRPESARAGYMVKLLEPARCPEASKIKKPSRDAERAAKAERAAADRVAAQERDAARAVHEDRPLVDLSGDTYLVAGELESRLKAKGNGRTLFQRGGMLTWRNGDRLVPGTRDLIRDLVGAVCRTGIPNEITGAWSDRHPTEATLGQLLAPTRMRTTVRDESGAPVAAWKVLDQIVAAPFMRTDGSVCKINGYDEASRTFLRMAPELAERLEVPDEPSAEDVAHAVKLLTVEWLGDMPFPTPADRANALALLLTPFIRGWVDVVPIAVIDGNGPSAGKGLLADLIGRVVLGAPMPLAALPADNDEQRKAITSAFLAGVSLLFWDEAHTLEGTSLAQLLTAPVWSDRKLGASETVAIPNRVTFAALGNNVDVNGDVARRAYRIRLHPAVERPEDRDAASFRHPDIRSWTDEHRAELLSAVLVLLRSWHVAGRPRVAGTFGSFEPWQRLVGGVLANAGVPGFLDGRREWLIGANVAGEAWTWHLVWLAETFRDRTFQTSDAVTELVRAGIDAPLPSHSRSLASPEITPAYARALGQVYRHRIGQWSNGLKLVREGTTDGSSRWAVVRRDATPTDKIILPVNPDSGQNGQNEGDQGSSKIVYKATPLQEKDVLTSENDPPKGIKGEYGDSDLALCEGDAETTCGGAPVVVGPGTLYFPLLPLSPSSETYVTSDGLEVTAAGDWLATLAQDYVSRCDEGHEEILVDGLWWACPICYPITARVDGRSV